MSTVLVQPMTFFEPGCLISVCAVVVEVLVEHCGDLRKHGKTYQTILRGDLRRRRIHAKRVQNDVRILAREIPYRRYASLSLSLYIYIYIYNFIYNTYIYIYMYTHTMYTYIDCL